jgi:hypothetical protein
LLLLLAIISVALAGPNKDHPVERYLYVWVGGGCAFPDSTGCSADYIATIDVWKKSLTYNTVVHRAFLPVYIPGVYGNEDYYTQANEAHHMFLAKDHLVAASRAPGNARVNGAITYPGKADIFVFELNTDHFPVFKFALKPSGACSDEITPVNGRETQFLVAHLCKQGNPGWAGGGISIIDITSGLTSNWILNGPSITATGTGSYTTGSLVFNPHSGDFDPNYGYVATNFVVPGTRRYGISLSHFAPNGQYRGEITYTGEPGNWANYVNSVFNTAAPSSGSGFMDIKYLDNDGHLITCASLQGVLYHVDVSVDPPTATPALDIAAAVNGGVRTFSGTTIRVIPGMNRLVTTYGLRYVVLVAWDDEYNFSVKASFDTCTIFTCVAANPTTTGVIVGEYSGAHYVKFSEDYETVYISTYYQGYPSTKRILAFELDSEFNTLTLVDDLDRAATSLLGGHNPHALAFRKYSPNARH